MNEPFLLSNLIDLQEIDNEIYNIESQKGGSENVFLLKELELQYNRANKDLEEAKNSLSGYFIQLEKDELDTKNIKQKIENIKVKLTDQSLDPNEIINYSKQKESSDQQLSKISKNIEILQSENHEELKEIKKFEDTIEEIKQKLIDISKRVKEEWKDLDVNLGESETRKKEMLLTFPEEYQKLYDDLKNRGVEVIAAYKLEDNKCGCCGVVLAEGEIDEISQSQYQQCPYCDGVIV
ncbi:MAG: zinc ribbon domain-containing protein [Candidatus Actinomarina sp.]